MSSLSLPIVLVLSAFSFLPPELLSFRGIEKEQNRTERDHHESIETRIFEWGAEEEVLFVDFVRIGLFSSSCHQKRIPHHSAIVEITRLKKERGERNIESWIVYSSTVSSVLLRVPFGRVFHPRTCPLERQLVRLRVRFWLLVRTSVCVTFWVTLLRVPLSLFGYVTVRLCVPFWLFCV